MGRAEIIQEDAFKVKAKLRKQFAHALVLAARPGADIQYPGLIKRIIEKSADKASIETPGAVNADLYGIDIEPVEDGRTAKLVIIIEHAKTDIGRDEFYREHL